MEDPEGFERAGSIPVPYDLEHKRIPALNWLEE